MKPALVLGLAWFKPEEYERHRELDPENLHATYAQWLKSAESVERKLRKDGVAIERVHVHPDELIVWCPSRNLRIGPKARSEFVAERIGRT